MQSHRQGLLVVRVSNSTAFPEETIGKST